MTNSKENLAHKKKNIDEEIQQRNNKIIAICPPFVNRNKTSDNLTKSAKNDEGKATLKELDSLE